MRKVVGIRPIRIARLRSLFMFIFANPVHGFFVSMITSDSNKGWLLTFKLNVFFAELPDDDGEDEDGNAGQAFGDCSPLAG